MENKEVKRQPKRGLWKPEEDLILKNYVETHGEGNWAAVSQKSGLLRGGKSCRLRWKNYLRPNIKRGGMSEEEEDLIIRMHKLIGNRWSLIAGRLPGRTDNEVKNYWNTHLNKKCRSGKRKSTDLGTHHGDINENGNSNVEKKLIISRLCGAQPLSSTSTQNAAEGLSGTREEDNTVTNGWTDQDTTTGSFDCDIECGLLPTITHNATFVFDDEPFITYLDSFVLF